MELRNISKQYNGRKIIEETSFSIYANQIAALVGKNGSGKSTLLRIIASLEKPDDGELTKKIQPLRISYVPEVIPPDIPFTPDEYLMHMGTIRGMDKNQLRQRIDHLLETFHLQDERKIRITNFSKGMKQKIAIMQAMLEDTDLLILDEPLSGLDPKAQRDLEHVLLNLKEKGLAVILTCHETKLLENLVDRVLLIKDQQVVHTNSLNKAGILENTLIFQIALEESLKELISLLRIEREERLSTGVKEIIATVKLTNTDKALIELLKKGASIKRLFPVNEDKEKFYNHF
jgi:ABC-2 type transport system ATP-binding protein